MVKIYKRKRLIRSIEKIQKLLTNFDVNEYRKKSLYYLTVFELKLEFERISWLIKLEKFVCDIEQEHLFLPSKSSYNTVSYTPVRIDYTINNVSNGLQHTEIVRSDTMWYYSTSTTNGSY